MFLVSYLVKHFIRINMYFCVCHDKSIKKRIYISQRLTYLLNSKLEIKLRVTQFWELLYFHLLFDITMPTVCPQDVYKRQHTHTLHRIIVNLLWSGGTGHTGGTLSQHAIWHANPHTSQTTPCRVKPTIKEVQWLHFVGDENVRTKNWWDLGLGGKWWWCACTGWWCDDNAKGELGSWNIPYTLNLQSNKNC